MKSKKSLKQIRESRKKLACELFMQHVTNRDSRNNRLRNREHEVTYLALAVYNTTFSVAFHGTTKK